eukprot:CAMPEP_0172874596 /NCGR_PEP_ID=MMETSP1075-20121228/98672_1 /TAXON_ID=2916 /ORGANISM="Ceratium fusus, Strain PA161109" /LENGTH=44 /DNA_ID= /DNA_START= /DNA_END= /DNA_ORIENTATION=
MPPGTGCFEWGMTGGCGWQHQASNTSVADSGCRKAVAACWQGLV